MKNMSKTLLLKVKVKGNIEAYKIVNRLHLIYADEIVEATYNSKIYQFSKTDKTKLPKHFLKENFGEESLKK